MLFLETNAKDVFEDLIAVLKSTTDVLNREELRLRSIISDGITQQFDTLGEGGFVDTVGGDPMAWDAISGMTKAVREDHWGTSGDDPVLVVTGALRGALEGGTTWTVVTETNGKLSYIPSVDQADKIDEHEDGFRVTSPVDIGREAPSRSMVFWGVDMADRVVQALNDGFDRLAKSRGF